MSTAVALQARSYAHAGALCADLWAGSDGETRFEVTVSEVGTGLPLGGVRLSRMTDHAIAVFPFYGATGSVGGWVRVGDTVAMRDAVVVMLRRAVRLAAA